ncbi:MAG: class I SAM-dependent methyltransferase [Fimbriimonadaceae bacterium]|nr:hypothetical protein [Chthonomonadaceae bacterium]MCO5296598.1 class I SAM-dependent methyltransferase [Fimbriimonadaceae bacterium]
MAKAKRTKGRGGYVFFKELGGAARRSDLSKTARVLLEQGFVRGRVLDYGCGHGFDADAHGWGAFDPYYRPTPPTGPYDTIVVNHVANVLTRFARQKLFADVDALLADGGVAYLSVARNIPLGGKMGARRRIQNHVVLTLTSVFCDQEEEIYAMPKGVVFQDLTREFEERL